MDMKKIELVSLENRAYEVNLWRFMVEKSNEYADKRKLKIVHFPHIGVIDGGVLIDCRFLYISSISNFTGLMFKMYFHCSENICHCYEIPKSLYDKQNINSIA